MEVFEWYLANPDGSYLKVRSGLSATELPQFLIDVQKFVGPLYSLLLKDQEPMSEPQVFDKTVCADPRLNDPHSWDGTSLEEIKRVNPELIRLLAAVSSEEVDSLAASWFSSPGVTGMVPSWDVADSVGEADARNQLTRVLHNLVELAKGACKRKKDVMERFWWPTQ